MLTLLSILALILAVRAEVCDPVSLTDDVTKLFYDYDAITDSTPPRAVPPTYSTEDIKNLEDYIRAVRDYLGNELLTQEQEDQIKAEVDRRWNAITAQNPTSSLDKHALSLCIDVKVKAVQDLFAAKKEALNTAADSAWDAFRLYYAASDRLIESLQEAVDEGDQVAILTQQVAIAVLRQAQRLQDIAVFVLNTEAQMLDDTERGILAVELYFDALEHDQPLIDANEAVKAAVLETIRWRIAIRRALALKSSIEEDWPKIVQSLKDNLSKLKDDLFAVWTDAVNTIKTHIQSNEELVRREIADALEGRRCNVTDAEITVSTNAQNQIVVNFKGINCNHPDHTAVELHGFACNALKAYLANQVTVTSLDHYTCVATTSKKRADTTFNAAVTGTEGGSGSALMAGLFILLLSFVFHF